MTKSIILQGCQSFSLPAFKTLSLNVFIKLVPDQKSNRNSNIYVGAQVCAYAREVIYDHMMRIEQVGGVIYAVDVDGLFFSLKKDTQDPLCYSTVCGDFKKMVEDSTEIVGFYCLGSRNYSLLLQEEGKNCSSVVKIKGLSLSSHALENVLSAETYKYSLQKFFLNELQTVIIPQEKFCINSHTKKIAKKCNNFSFQNDLYIKRFVPLFFCFTPRSRVDTHPFGFRPSLKRKADDEIESILFD